jgi:hypothetical protein
VFVVKVVLPVEPEMFPVPSFGKDKIMF